MQQVRVRVVDGEPARVWWSFPSQTVIVLRRYTLPARYRSHPTYGRLVLRWKRRCWHLRRGNGTRASLVYEPATGRWLIQRAGEPSA